jgi:hypothetical protein
LSDIFPLIDYFQGVSVETETFAIITGNVHVRQKEHFDFENTLPSTCFAAAALDIKTETAGPVSPCPSLWHLRQQVSGLGKDPGVSGRVRPGGATDGGLVNMNNLV